MNLSPGSDQPAPRTQGDAFAMGRAYSTGHVFDGRLNVPAIDHRQYMGRELDMHNVHQSFAVRQRVLTRMGHSDNLVIWFTDTMPGVPKVSQSMEALAVMDEWMANIRANPTNSIAQNKPARAVDSCFDLNGRRMQAGAGVWDGILDKRPAGACTPAWLNANRQPSAIMSLAAKTASGRLSVASNSRPARCPEASSKSPGNTQEVAFGSASASASR